MITATRRTSHPVDGPQPEPRPEAPYPFIPHTVLLAVNLSTGESTQVFKIPDNCWEETQKLLDVLINNPPAHLVGLASQMKEFRPARGGRPGIPLRVVKVDHEIYDPYILSHKAVPFGPDDVPKVFGSVSSLARHLGVHAPNMNYLMMQLRAEKDPKEWVTARGVTFQLDTYRD